MPKSLGLYCFSRIQLKIEQHAKPSKDFEFIDLRNQKILEYRKRHEEDKTDLESEFLWRMYSILSDSGNSYNYCYKYHNYDPAKLLNFRMIHDKTKICISNDEDLLEKVRDLYSRMAGINGMSENLMDLLYNTSLASRENDGFIDDFMQALKTMTSIRDGMQENITEEFNENFCRF